MDWALWFVGPHSHDHSFRPEIGGSRLETGIEADLCRAQWTWLIDGQRDSLQKQLVIVGAYMLVADCGNQ